MEVLGHFLASVCVTDTQRTKNLHYVAPVVEIRVGVRCSKSTVGHVVYLVRISMLHLIYVTLCLLTSRSIVMNVHIHIVLSHHIKFVTVHRRQPAPSRQHDTPLQRLLAAYRVTMTTTTQGCCRSTSP